MTSDDKKERWKQVALEAKKKLAEGTWPQVMAVSQFSNFGGERINEEEFVALKEIFIKLECLKMADFADHVHFAEKQFGQKLSFNFTLRPRKSAEIGSDLTEESFVEGLLFPDLLVGTRRGEKGALEWLKSFTTVAPEQPSEYSQVMDKIFGEAVELLRGPATRTNLAELLRSSMMNEMPIMTSKGYKN